MANLSSDLMSRKELIEEYHQEYDRAIERIFLSCFIKTEQGVIKIKEFQPPSNIAILKEIQSSGTISTRLSTYVKFFITEEDKVDSIPVDQELAIEKPTNAIIDPCNLPNCDVVGQETNRSSLAEIVDPKSPSMSIKSVSSTSTLGGQQNKGNGAGCIVTGLTGSQTGLTASSRVSQNKLKPKMVKPKKPEIGVWKTIESKGRHKHQREKPKYNKKLPAKSQRQKIVNDASRSKNSKQSKSSHREKFHNRDRQWNNSHKSMPFPPYGSPTPMPWESCFNMPYSYSPWYYNSYMPSLPRYLCSDYITYREPVINKPSPMHNDRFDQKNRSTQKNKHTVIRQVYRVKKDGRLNKNPDLTLDIEKPCIEKSSASYVDQIVPNNKHITNIIAEQQSCSAGGQYDLSVTGSEGIGLTALRLYTTPKLTHQLWTESDDSPPWREPARHSVAGDRPVMRGRARRDAGLTTSQEPEDAPQMPHRHTSAFEATYDMYTGA
ncbi:hypothetical protein OsI_07691 [Oryza sativa Indica Group]|uniref:Uncharacterized protein n=1 Tax=Oryza sativa subsp. indica TaxID=39946 RepID=A2X656_ORYSI|nr:hypothetical protein OsI_07691 [Oryza sativa Indica Group]